MRYASGLAVDLNEYATCCANKMQLHALITHPDWSCRRLCRAAVPTFPPSTHAEKDTAVPEMLCVMQGSMVRTVRRCEELLRQLADAARVVGDHQLIELFDTCIEAIKRDIVFAASLYL